MKHQCTPLRLIRPAPLRQIARDAVVDYRRRQQIVLEQASIVAIASAQGHSLGPWRVEGRATVAAIQCWACGEGARLDLEWVFSRLTAGLTQRCAGLPQHTSVTGEVI
jgi:hypothetical protein